MIVGLHRTGKVDRVYLAYNEFKNAGSQITRVVQILPVKPEEDSRRTGSRLHLRAAARKSC